MTAVIDFLKYVNSFNKLSEFQWFGAFCRAPVLRHNRAKKMKFWDVHELRINELRRMVTWYRLPLSPLNPLITSAGFYFYKKFSISISVCWLRSICCSTRDLFEPILCTFKGFLVRFDKNILEDRRNGKDKNQTTKTPLWLHLSCKLMASNFKARYILLWMKVQATYSLSSMYFSGARKKSIRFIIYTPSSFM